MKKIFLITGYCLLAAGSYAQTVNQKLQKAFQQFEADPQLKHAISSLYVIDAKTGKVIFDKNSQAGLAPASTQKIITSITAFELLGKDYKYKTQLGYTGKIENDSLGGDLVIAGSGDPALGSWRYVSTVDSVVLERFAGAVIALGIKSYGRVVFKASDYYSPKNTPDGWIWQDIGNYYGASAKSLNWLENQYDLFLRSEDVVEGKVMIERTKPFYFRENSFINMLKCGEKGSGDNVYIYSGDGHYILTGTIPRGEKSFKVSGSINDPAESLIHEFKQKLVSKKIITESNVETIANKVYIGEPIAKKSFLYTSMYTHYSPSLDSIIYWFLKKSINLYGEALIKTFAYEKKGFGATDSGVAIVRDFWKQKGLDENELNIKDGSGLSPLNRVTTHAQVVILKYAKTRNWFPYFYDALPEYNGMKMKSGTISDVKGFCGYHKAKDGNEYIFSFLVNNYNGFSAGVVNKMYTVLNVLK
jgi:D-alanyl-D-alanine carboxypeptidase/D-alanyl-D-alanine-endopeptidase (penicillin-binding protein 4)